MRVISVSNQKGGVGKTAVSVHLAHYLSQKGFRVLVIDLDTQANASYSLGDYEKISISDFLFNKTKFHSETNLDLIASDEFLADIDKKEIDDIAPVFKESLLFYQDKYDFCIIDTAPSLNNSMAMALLASDYVVSPIEPETYSILGLSSLIRTINNIKAINTNLDFIGVILSRVDNRNPRHKSALNEIKESVPDLVIGDQISLLSSVAESLDQKIPVWELKNNKGARKSAKEFHAMFELVLNKLNNKE